MSNCCQTEKKAARAESAPQIAAQSCGGSAPSPQPPKAAESECCEAKQEPKKESGCCCSC